MPRRRWKQNRGRWTRGFAIVALAATTAGSALAAGPSLQAADEATEHRPSTKRDVPSSRLLVPFFKVDVNGASGAATLFALRNESLSAVDADIHYFEIDSPQAPQKTERVTLAAKSVHTVNIGFVSDLEVDPDGFARGYVLIDQVGDGAAVLHGDTFQIDPANDFATGTRLVNVDPDDPDNDLCAVVSIRFLQGGAFDGGTVYRFWIDTKSVPLAEGSLAYDVYDEAGMQVANGALTPDRAAFEIPASQLLVGPAASTNFGVIEFQLSGLSGHVSSTLSALGRYSVGIESTCID